MKDIWMKQEMKMKEINEKTFRDCGSGFIIGLNLLEEKGYCHAKYNDINSFA